MPWSQIFNMANMSFDAIRENKILSKIYEFPVVPVHEGGSVQEAQHVCTPI